MNLNNIAEFLLNYINNLFISNFHIYGYLIIFFSAIFESIPILGTLVPGQLLIIFAGFLASNSFLNLYLLILIVSIGAILGDIIAFEMGRRFGKEFLVKYGKYFLLNETRNKNLEIFIKKNFGKTIFLGRFNNLTRALIPFLAGSLKIDYFKFLFWNILTGIIWSIVWVLVGFFGGESFKLIAKSFNLGILIFTIILILGYFSYNFFKNRNSKVVNLEKII